MRVAFRPAAILVTLGVGLASALEASEPGLSVTPQLESLGWMSGSWGGRAGALEMEEYWTTPAGGVMLGLHRDLRDARLVSFEYARIEVTPAGIAYQASPRGAPPTTFMLVEATAKRAVFENPEHDFPKRIVYWAKDDELCARVEGQAGQPGTESWCWPRRR